MTSNKTKFWIWSFAVLHLFVAIPALASNATDVRNDRFGGAWSGGTLNTTWPAYGLGGTSYMASQVFVPEHNNLSRLHVVCSKNFGQTLIGYFAICKGTPQTDHYNGSASYALCSGAGNTFVSSTTLQSVYCNYGNTETIITLGTPVTSYQNYFFEFLSTSTITTNAFKASEYYSSNIAFSLDYETTYTQSPTITITSPVNGYTETSENNILFTGSVRNATDFQILYGSQNASPANEIVGMNLGSNLYNYSYNVQIANGSYWVWYIAKSGTLTTIATTSLYVQSNNANIADVNVSTTSISSTTAYKYLASTTINCASSAPAFISDPATLYTQYSPIFNNASTTEQSYYFDFATNTTARTQVLATATRKIIYIQNVQDSTTNLVHMYCGNIEISDNQTQANYVVELSYNCESAIYIDKSIGVTGVASTIRWLESSTATTSVPRFYSFVTTGIYTVIRWPVDMANKFSCYLSSDIAKQKGQGAGAMLGYWAQLGRSFDNIFPIPLFSIVVIWIIGLGVWFARKLLPFFK